MDLPCPMSLVFRLLKNFLPQSAPALTLLAAGLFHFHPRSGLAAKKLIHVGIIAPVQHPAMDDIVQGVKEAVQAALPQADQQVKITTLNANGDPNLRHQLVQKMQHDKVDYLMPIGTAAFLESLSIFKKKPVIGIAAEANSDDLTQEQAARAIIVNDHISPEHILKLVLEQVKGIKKVGILYSNSDKMLREIEQAKKFCTQHGVIPLFSKVDMLQEVQPYGAALFKKVDAVLVFKDLLVVSGIAGLVGLAKRHKKLLITLDDGSVRNGAHFGLGIPEKQIGIASGEQLVRLLRHQHSVLFHGTPTTTSQPAAPLFGTVLLEQLTLFYNSAVLSRQNFVTRQQLATAAKAMAYSCVDVTA